MTERDVALERHLTNIAAQAAGLTKPGPNGKPTGDDRGLRRFADYRTHPGPLRTPRDWDREAAEELADCANYLTWGMAEVYDGYVEGDAVACAAFDRRMRALRRVVEAWHDLHTDAH